MSARIRVNTESLKRGAAELAQLAVEFDKLGSSLYGSIAPLNDYGGQLPNKKTALLVRHDAQSMQIEIAEMDESLRRLAAMFEQADQERNVVFQGLLDRLKERLGWLAEFLWGAPATTPAPTPPMTFTPIFPVTIPPTSMEEAETPTPVEHISPEGITFIARHEATILELYNDPSGNCTIGVGHLVHMGARDGRESETPFKDGITKEQAYDMLAEDVTIAEQAVRDLVTVPLTQAQFDALVSFVYNLGRGQLKESDLLEKLNTGDYDAVAEELNKYVHGSDGQKLPGLVTRRKDEGDLFDNGAYGNGQ